MFAVLICFSVAFFIRLYTKYKSMAGSKTLTITLSIVFLIISFISILTSVYKPLFVRQRVIIMSKAFKKTRIINFALILA